MKGLLSLYFPYHRSSPVRGNLYLVTLEFLADAVLYDDRSAEPHEEKPAEEMVQGFLPRMPESPERLDLLLLTVARGRKVRRDGIHFEGFTYLDPLLGSFVGEDVIIRYDPRDLAEISVYHGGEFVCRAVSQELAEQTVSLAEIRRARESRRRELREGIRERTSVADAVLRLQSRPPLPLFSSDESASEQDMEVPSKDERRKPRPKSGSSTTLRRYRNE